MCCEMCVVCCVMFRGARGLFCLKCVDCVLSLFAIRCSLFDACCLVFGA